MNQDLDQKSIDQIIDKKLAIMEAEYELFKKYDNPNYKGADYPIDQINNQSNDNQQKENDDEEQDQGKDKDENMNLDEDDEFQEYQGYEKMEENSDKEEEDDINYDQVEHVDPFAKPLDVDLIKKCMAEIHMPTPAWAQNLQGWEQRLSQMKQL
ncbi:unnamed protein product (macronuclear) [Paramecium tetraurelia]|uniref:Chromosome undetermined scaffold_10, whole genome shotgun sequence n=1 Tax=Paramecium tetraurelia TaxID=5888 RepID=A0BD16_PARTE|nr:uncharacterized protein GSPATT00004527001 [Paramecium tetraurelia]XP_001440963.1 uncharacterized protein GSPATT00038917001 [Paramecium tetraurelia]CAK56433.1 unnamed protein product [Paramecium tetraurelia]CAK73566.1 unnamed protein product [Paramecium tetraurelia]|eukprot:XP_001423831.1 hypothetical protein (macronuclear) [Paramecium tetraurelia strain d4-2]